MSRSLRLLQLLQALRGRRQPVTAAELARQLEVSERTVYRDVADLVAQGAPIAGEAGVGYILRPGLFLPPLMLSDEEVEAVVLGLRLVDQRGDAVLQSAAAAALAKIGAVISPEAQAQMSAPLSLPGPAAKFPGQGAPLGDLRAAICEQVRLDIRYSDGLGRSTERIVWPIQLGFMDQARVLFAWCELRADFRTFRTDRLAAMARLDRYAASRSKLVRRLRNHLAAQAEHTQAPDGS